MGGHDPSRPPVATRRAIDHRNGFLIRRSLDRRGPATVVLGERQWGRQGVRRPSIGTLAAHEGALLLCLEHLHATALLDTTWTAADWEDSVALARRALPARADSIAPPAVSLRNDRWCGPLLRPASTRYALRFCVDGRAYAIRGSDGAAIAFEDHGAAARWVSRDRREAWSGTSQRPLGDAEAGRIQDRRFDALFEHGRDAVERVFEAIPPETADSRTGVDPRGFDAGIERLAARGRPRPT